MKERRFVVLIQKPARDEKPLYFEWNLFSDDKVWNYSWINSIFSLKTNSDSFISLIFSCYFYFYNDTDERRNLIRFIIRPQNNSSKDIIWPRTRHTARSFVCIVCPIHYALKIKIQKNLWFKFLSHILNIVLRQNSLRAWGVKKWNLKNKMNCINCFQNSLSKAF